MLVNKRLMALARVEKRNIGELTVKEFRTLMQDCFDADRAKLEQRTAEHMRSVHEACTCLSCIGRGRKV